MHRIKRNLLPIFLLLVFASIVIVFRSGLMSYLIEPIATMLWVVWRILSSVDQRIVWFALVGISAFLGVRPFLSMKERQPKPAYRQAGAALSRVQRWQVILEDAFLGENERDALRDALKNLSLKIIAQNHPSDMNEVEATIAEIYADLSPAARQYLFPSRDMDGKFSLSRLRISEIYSAGWFRKRPPKSTRQDFIWIEEIVETLEDDLDITRNLETNHEG
jgi:hypothetical protein